MDTRFIQTNGIQLAYTDIGTGAKTLFMMHGLTANRYNFGGLIRHGLADGLRVILVDLRGRGMSDKPLTGYTMADHAADILGMLDALHLDSVIMGGHSFGGLLTMYLTAHHPERVQKQVILDAGLEATDSGVLEKIRPSLERLGKPIPSFEQFITAIKASPYYENKVWDDDIEMFYRQDMVEQPDGSVMSRCRADAIEAAVKGVISDDWQNIIPKAAAPAVLIHASGNIGQLPPILSLEGAQNTVRLLPNCQYVPVGGNHVTMVYGDHAPQVVNAIHEFVMG